MVYTVEIVVTTLAGAIEAEAGGADRLELCSALAGGGVTPSPGLFLEVKKAVKIPVFVLIRPREGDFVYTEADIQTMLRDIRWFRENGADGMVCGANTSEGGVDIPAMERMMEAAEELPVTFHRAIDVCNDPLEALEDVIELGCARVLTSGGRPRIDATAVAVIHEMAERAAEAGVIILPGGGVNASNITLLTDHPYIIEYHHSAKKRVPSETTSDIFDTDHFAVDQSIVRLI